MKKKKIAVAAAKGKSLASSAINGVSSFLNAVYARVPVLPFLDRPTSAILFLTIALYLAFTGWVFLSSPSTELRASISEAPLLKNSPLLLLPGEHYVYLVSGAGQTATVSYTTVLSPSCSGLQVVEENSQTGACLLQNGNLEGDWREMNSTFGNQSLLLFSPWMLAVSDNFFWGVQAALSMGSAEIQIASTYKSLGKKQIAGRSAYEISFESEVGPPSKFYVDSEKRVLLLADLGNASAKLVEAPFALNWSSSD